MKALWKMKISVISLALLLAIGGCSSNAVPTTSPVKVDAPKQSQTQDTTAKKDTVPSPAAPITAPEAIVSPAPTSVVAPSPTPITPPVVAPAPTPATPAVMTQSVTPKQANQSLTVYITKTGKKYHRDGCRYLSKSKIPISLSDAESEGYGACSVCNPPQ